MIDSALPTFRIPERTCIPQAQPEAKGAVSLASPALDVMTDLTQVRAATAAPDVSLDTAEQLMIHQGVRMLFIVRELPCIEGLITTTDLLGEKPMRVIQQRGIRHQDLRVADVMTELSMIDAIDFDVLKAATVRHVIATFRKFGRNHLLVVQGFTADSPARIRGVLSLTQLERQLGYGIGSTEIASSFAEIERVLL
jgi:CBS-domain-containing membrane protein